MTDTLSCWNCGAELRQVLLPVSRHEYCPDCAEAVHCCRQCIHYSLGAVEQCREDRAEPPTLKESANFCDFFSPRFTTAAGPSQSSKDLARARLDALFGDAPDDESPPG
jgi:hypothetical protein